MNGAEARIGIGRWLALARKELRQIRRDKRLMVSLLVPPTLQVLLFGYALSSQVGDLRLGVADLSHTADSRELVAVLTESRAFRLVRSYDSPKALGADLSGGRLDAGLIVPPDFTRRALLGPETQVQVLLDAVNANTAEIAQGYLGQTLGAYARRGAPGPRPARVAGIAAAAPLNAHITLLYNPGLKTAWFIVTGIFGVLLILNGSLVASATMIREKDTGTIEPLLMTPAGATEIVSAKMVPLFLLLMVSASLVLLVGHAVFGLPVRGSVAVVMLGAAFCILCGIGMGTLIATISRTGNQAQLMGFFINPPLATLSGAFTPIEAMPAWLRPVTVLNPVRHFAILARSVLVKGSGVEAVAGQLAALALFALVIVGLSAWRFRRQLSA